MNVKSVEKLEKSQVAVTVEVTAEEFEAAVQKAYLKMRNKISVPGFRPGKAPRKMIEKLYGEGVFYSDAVDAALPDAYTQAIGSSGLDVVGYPEVEIVDDQIGKDGFTFKAIVAVYPEVELGQYKGVSAVKEEAKVTADDVKERLNQMAEREARLVSVDRKVKKGDTAVIDFEGFDNGVAFEGGKGENHELEIGSGSFVPGFEDQIIGMKAEEEKDIDITFPEDYHKELAGKAVVFHVKCNEVKFEELPELDDEFAKDNDFDTLADLKADIRAKSVEEKEKAAKNAFDDALVDQAVENMTVDMPEGMIEERMDGIVREYAQYMVNQGIRIDDYLKMIGTDMKTFRESMRATAEKQARTEVLLAAVAEAENVQISEEDLQAEYEKLGEAYGMKAEDVAKAIDVAGLTADLRRERAMSIISESGVAVEKKAEEPAKTEEASKAKKKPAAKKAAKTEETEGEEAPKAKKTTRKSTKTEEKTEE